MREGGRRKADTDQKMGRDGGRKGEEGKKSCEERVMRRKTGATGMRRTRRRKTEEARDDNDDKWKG